MKCACGSEIAIKKGYYRPRSNNYQPIARYFCKACQKTFSRQTDAATHRQKKPQINSEILKWYSSGNTQRRMARIMQINRKTVVRKFLFLAKLASEEHQRRILAGELKTSFVQFDDIETFEHTRLKPLSIALAVRAKTGEIIDAKIATMNAKGYIAKIAQQKYGRRQDTREQAVREILATVAQCSRANLTIVTDGKTDYPASVQAITPHAVMKQYPRGKKKKVDSADRKNKNDKLFTINYMAAKLRNDLSRLARKTWCTTKSPERLQAHLNLYIAFNNGYDLAI